MAEIRFVYETTMLSVHPNVAEMLQSNQFLNVFFRESHVLEG